MRCEIISLPTQLSWAFLFWRGMLGWLQKGEMEMKGVFALVLGAFLMLSPLVVLAEVDQPQLPVGLEKWRPALATEMLPCGVLEGTVYIESEKVIWAAFFLNRSEHGRPFVIAKLRDNSEEFWVDKNRDGVFEEYYSDEKVFDQKYSDFCDVVK